MDDSSTPTWKKKLRAAGESLNDSGNSELDSVRQEAGAAASKMDSYRKGGKVRKTGPAKLHRGERVIPKKDVKRVEKLMRKGKGRSKKGR